MQIHPPAALLHPAAYGLYLTLRRTVSVAVDDPHAQLELRGPRIFACRHGELLPLLFAMEGRGLSILVSRSDDGELLASMLRRRGFGLLRGSSSQASFAAARELLRALDRGREIGLAADGPRGPRGRVQSGLLRLAQRSGAPIVPLKVVSGWRCVVGASWDRFEFPLPGARCSIRVAAPIEVGKGEPALRAAGRRLAQELEGSYPGHPDASTLGALRGYSHS